MYVTISVRRTGLNTEAEGTKTAYPSLNPFTYKHKPLPQVQGHNVGGYGLHR